MVDSVKTNGKTYGPCKVCGLWTWLPTGDAYAGRCILCAVRDLQEGDVEYQQEWDVKHQQEWDVEYRQEFDIDYQQKKKLTE
jgi:hypothetical protein